MIPLPQQIRSGSDNFMKFAALALSCGWVIHTPLAKQRIHGANTVTGRFSQHTGRAHAMNSIFIGEALRRVHPDCVRLSEGVFARAVSEYLRFGGTERLMWSLIAADLRAMNFRSQANVLLRSLYHFSRVWLRGVDPEFISLQSAFENSQSTSA
jgi:hypothetical protein